MSKADRVSVPSELTVTRVDGLCSVLRYAADIDRLNGQSVRPNPFLSAAFLECYGLRSEYFLPGSGELLFVVRDAKRVLGLAPMRRVTKSLLPRALGPLDIRSTRLEFLDAADTEQLQFLSAPADEERVARAIVRHICAREHGWGMLELAGQKPGSTLHRALHELRDRRFRARDIAVEPYSEISFVWPNLKSYFKSLTRRMRSSVSRQGRKLYAHGEVELVLARGAGATSAWFDAYLDLDERSWKSGTESSIRRSPRRVSFYRELVAGIAGLEPSFIGVVLEGVLVAGLILGSNQTTSPARYGTWALEMAYDRTQAELGPGQLLFLLAVGEGLERGDGFLNFMQNFAYYKHRWAAKAVDVVNVQLIRHASLQAVRAGVGDVRRYLQARKASAKAEAQPYAQTGTTASAEPTDVEAPDSGRAAPPAVDVATARRLTAAALAYAGGGVRRLDRAAARTHLPFDL